MLFNLNKRFRKNEEKRTPQNQELKRDITTGKRGIKIIDYE